MFGILSRHIAKRMQLEFCADNFGQFFFWTFRLLRSAVNSITNIFSTLLSTYPLSTMPSQQPSRSNINLAYNTMPSHQPSKLHSNIPVTFKVLPLNQFSQHYLLRGNTPNVQRANRQLNHSPTYQPIAESSVSRLIKHWYYLAINLTSFKSNFKTAYLPSFTLLET